MSIARETNPGPAGEGRRIVEAGKFELRVGRISRADAQLRQASLSPRFPAGSAMTTGNPKWLPVESSAASPAIPHVHLRRRVCRHLYRYSDPGVRPKGARNAVTNALGDDQPQALAV